MSAVDSSNDHPAKRPKTASAVAAVRPNLVFAVRGQMGEIPAVGLGTAGLGAACEDTVAKALTMGYRHIDTALLYANQKEVGAGLRKSGVPRKDVWLTSKVSFFPQDAKGCFMFSDDNIKGQEAASIELCLERLGVDQLDLLLIHNPASCRAEFDAAVIPHFFELAQKGCHDVPKVTPTLPGGDSVRALLSAAKLKQNKDKADCQAALESRKQCWKAMEAAKQTGKARYIGVSNYSAELLQEMATYAEIMPAVNQLELHPRFASPELRKVAAELGVVLVAYGSAHSVSFKEHPAIIKIAETHGRTAYDVVLAWTLQHGIGIIPRSDKEEHLLQNFRALGFQLTAEQMTAIDALDEDYCYYWDHHAWIHAVQATAGSNTKSDGLQ